MTSPILEVVSDYACPWCYYSTPALATLAAEGVEVHRRSFQILPDIPLEGISVNDYDAMRGNTPQDRADKNRINAKHTSQLGLPWVPRQRFFQSRPAHLLHHWAESLGLGGEAFHRVVYDLQYGEGRNIAQPEVLREIATRSGLPLDQLEQALLDPRWQAEFTADGRKSHEQGINGVPYYVYQGQVYPGYRSLEALRALLNQG